MTSSTTTLGQSIGNSDSQPTIDRVNTLSLSWRIAFLAVLAWSSVMAYQLAASGIRHDYRAYVEQWSHILAGGDPWQDGGIPFNAYGPLHSMLAYTATQSFLIPKFIFGFAFIVLNFLLVLKLLESKCQIRSLDWFIYILIIPANYLVIGAVFLFGNNDALVAAFIGFGVLARLRGSLRIAGVLFGLAILLKFYPLLLLPFLVLDGRKLLVRPLIWSGITLLAGFGLTLARWGTSFTNAITGGVERDATILSILNFLREHGLHPETYRFMADVNTLVVLGATAALFVVTWRLRLDWLASATLAMIVIAALYKVGHQQFLLTWLVLLACLFVTNPPANRRLVLYAMPLVVGLSVFQFFFVRFWNEGQFWDAPGTVLRVHASLPFALITVLTVVLSLRHSVSTPTENGPPGDD